MNIFCICGSANKNSINQSLLLALAEIAPQHNFTYFDELTSFPIFTPTKAEKPPENVKEFKNLIVKADVVLIATPEYIHNIPAVLKNALEWVTGSGEFYEKKVVAITFTPQLPRGEKAMGSLLNSLQALNAKVLTQLPLYQNEINISKENIIAESLSKESLKAMLEFL